MRVAVVGSFALAACTFTPPTNSDLVTLTDDNEVDFAAHAELEGGVVTPWGTIEPSAFVIGGLHARAFAGSVVADQDTYDDVVVKATAPLGASYRQLPTDWNNQLRPVGLGLPNRDFYTVFYDGEIQLPLGVQDLELNADDRAIVQVALDGKTFGERLFAHNAVSTIRLDVRTAGWFPIRVAYAQEAGDARFLLTVVQSQNRTPIGADQLRARVTDQPGLVVFAFDTLALLKPVGETAVPTIDQAFGVLPPPYDLGIALGTFSLRHIGQLRIDTQGTYTFHANVGTDADDGYRVWIDGALVISYWLGSPFTPMANVDLAPGWHDIVVDYADTAGNAQVTLLMAGPGIADAAIDPAHLRPAVASGLVASFGVNVETPIKDADFTEQPLTVIGPDLGVVETVDYGFGIRNHRITDLTVELHDCKGVESVPVSTTDPLLETFFYFSSDPSCANTPLVPATPWSFRFVDALAGNDGIGNPVFTDPILVASYHGGPRKPFPDALTFVSAPKPTPGATRIDAIRLTAVDHGAQIQIAVRTGADEASLAAAPWTIVENGQVPSVPAGELVQYQLAITSDGWQYPTIDKVELDYATQ
jgi:hypothetical protein